MKNKELTAYAALLRGINVGGKKKVPMADLRKMLADLGFRNVRTLLNSGNAVFEAEQAAEESLARQIERIFMDTFGFESKIMLRTMDDLKKLVALDPFANVTANKDTRLYVTFLRNQTQSNLKLPYTSDAGGFQVLGGTDREVFTALTIETAESVKAMAFIEQEYGKDVTTRNWNTVMRLKEL